MFAEQCNNKKNTICVIKYATHVRCLQWIDKRLIEMYWMCQILCDKTSSATGWQNKLHAHIANETNRTEIYPPQKN